MDKAECVVIGAGVIGLAVARRLARAGREVIVLEAAEGIGTVTSSRNSEVIHAGIYYAAGSLMARMCVNGKRALYDYCRDHGIPHRNCGKLIVATSVARGIDGMPIGLIPPAYLAKGNYFSCSARAPFSHLIYPVPEPGGLGVHLTLDMAGQTRFGPDVEWVDAIDYAVDPARAERFYPAIRRYWPALPDGSLMPSYSGIRPKIVPPAVAAQDFVIQGPQDHGVCGLINLFGIESPGLTSSLAIADHVGALAEV